MVLLSIVPAQVDQTLVLCRVLVTFYASSYQVAKEPGTLLLKIQIQYEDTVVPSLKMNGPQENC